MVRLDIFAAGRGITCPPSDKLPLRAAERVMIRNTWQFERDEARITKSFVFCFLFCKKGTFRRSSSSGQPDIRIYDMQA